MKKLCIMLSLFACQHIGAMTLPFDDVPSDQVIAELYIENKACLYDRELYTRFLEVIKPSIRKSLQESDNQKLHKILPVGVSVIGMRQILMKCLEPLINKDSQALTAHYTYLMEQDKRNEFSELLASAKILGIELIISTGHAFLGDAAAQGRLDFVAVLLKSGAAVDFVDEQGVSPLMRAAQNGHLEVVRYLIKQGASKDLRDKSGISLLEHSALRNRDEILKELGGQEAQKDSALFKRKIKAGLLARKSQENISKAADLQGTDSKNRPEGPKHAQKNGDEMVVKKTDKAQSSWFSLQNGLLLGIFGFCAYLYYEYTQDSRQTGNKARRAV